MHVNGKPSPQEMEDIFKEEEELLSPSFTLPPTQDEQPPVEDAILSDADGYNPEFESMNSNIAHFIMLAAQISTYSFNHHLPSSF